MASNSCKDTSERLRKIFATQGIPERLDSDNCAPFNSREYAEEIGLHHRITPDHPRANGETESFIKVLNKTEKIARSEGTVRHYSKC